MNCRTGSVEVDVSKIKLHGSYRGKSGSKRLAGRIWSYISVHAWRTRVADLLVKLENSLTASGAGGQQCDVNQSVFHRLLNPPFLSSSPRGFPARRASVAHALSVVASAENSLFPSTAGHSHESRFSLRSCPVLRWQSVYQRFKYWSRSAFARPADCQSAIQQAASLRYETCACAQSACASASRIAAILAA